MPLDLLAPLGAEHRLRDNYVHQLRQTIDAYLPSYIFVGEAMQNALDAVRESGGGNSRISVDLDFDQRRVTVRDTGKGFPDQPSLLFLGGGTKIGRGLAGMVGVGLKVILFSSSHFSIRARNSEKRIQVKIDDAFRFGEAEPPAIELPDSTTLPEDPETGYFSAGTGTEISYEFPPGENGITERFLRDVHEDCITTGNPNFDDILAEAVERGGYHNRLSALLASHFRRFTYLGSTQEREEFRQLKIEVSITGSPESLGPLAEYADGRSSVKFEVAPRYLTVTDTLAWVKAPKPVIHRNPLGDGGTNLGKTKLGFNITTYNSPDEYESLLVNARGRKNEEQLERFQRLLFPRLNRVTLTVGRIPQFNMYLPGGARRVISARGVITSHDIDVSSGQNQQYVRCFDIIVDVDADLNYGKTMLTDMHLVANVRRFVNEAYRAVIQNAARNFVGTLRSGEPTESTFWSRDPLGIDGLSQKKVPYDENDVIALFFELTGLGHFSEFRWYGLSSSDAYDGRAIIRRPGDPSRLDTEPRDTDLRVIEFKLRGASIARDFDRETKRPERVDLVICYEIGDSPIDLYQVVPLEDSALGQSGEEPYPGVTHVLLDTVTEREVQLLPLMSYLETVYPSETLASIPGDVQDED
jgi:hypothetical protein